MKKVYICSQLRGAVQKNIRLANIFCRFAYEQGYMPIAPHCIFTQFLDDEKKNERSDGMKMGIELLRICSEMWVFGINISKGMAQEIEIAKRLKKKIRFFTADMEERNARDI